MNMDSKHQKMYPPKDRITDLHESIIHHILSYLPAKDAVATSILSTKWKHLWTSIPNLEFDDTASKLAGNSVIESHFRVFVRRVLSTHASANRNIRKFVLFITKKYSPVELTNWIHYAITRNIRELLLDIIATPLVLPHLIFTSNTLTILKIETEQNVRFPSVIRFSGLKVLHLGFVYVCTDVSAKQILIDCPVLEQMSLIECEWLKISTVAILAPVLKELVIEDYPDCDNDVLYSCVINFFTDSLGLFELKSNLPYVYSLNNVSSLVRANVDLLPNIPSNALVMQRVEKLLRGIFNVKSLILSNRTIASLSSAYLLSHLATFSNLTHLSVNVESDNGVTIRHLVDLLCHLPEIDSLVFTNLHGCPLEEHSWTLDTKRLSFLSRLKSVELKDFCGRKTELCLAKFVLNNARHLKKFSVFIVESDSKEKMEILQQLRMLAAQRELKYLPGIGEVSSDSGC